MRWLVLVCLSGSGGWLLSLISLLLLNIRLLDLVLLVAGTSTALSWSCLGEDRLLVCLLVDTPLIHGSLSLHMWPQIDLLSDSTLLEVVCLLVILSLLRIA